MASRGETYAGEVMERLRPQRGREPDLLTYLQTAYLEEKALAERLESWAQLVFVPSLARGVRELAKEDRAHARAVDEIIRGLGGVPPKGLATAPPIGDQAQGEDFRALLREEISAQKRIQILYLDAASLAKTEGLSEIGAKLEALRGEEEAGRKALLSLVTKLPPFRAEE